MLKIIKRENLLKEIRKLDEVNIYLKERHDVVKYGEVKNIYLPLDEIGFLKDKTDKQLLKIRNEFIEANLYWVNEIQKIESN